MNTETKIGLSSAFGAIIGGTIAWYAHHAWWAFAIGLVVGAVTSYFSYEWKDLVADPEKKAQLKQRFYHLSGNLGGALTVGFVVSVCVSAIFSSCNIGCGAELDGWML